MKTKILIGSLIVALLVSLFYNLKPAKTWFISFPDANTRPTYNTYHHINEAHKLATGKGIKVGIIGKYFGFLDHQNMYAGGKDFTGDSESFEEIAEHGLWMATTLKEIAPDVEIYALCARENNREKEAQNISDAIDWAIANNLNILTYSAQAFRPEDRTVIDQAVGKAIAHGIVTTFIHYDLANNLLPDDFFPGTQDTGNREADVNIFHFDYNLLMIFRYENYLKSNRQVGNNVGGLPYFSNSSMSPVLAGIVAMMMEINPHLSPEAYKNTLVKTSYKTNYKGHLVSRVADAPAAISYLMNATDEKESSTEKIPVSEYIR